MSSLALIMESGKLILANEVMKSKHIKKFTLGYKKAENIAEYEYSLLGTTTYYLSGLLFEYWNLEPLFVEILKGLDFEIDCSEKVQSYIDSIDAVRVAVNVRDVLTKDSIYEACGIVEDMGLDPEHFEKIANRVKEQYNRVRIKRMRKKQH